MPIRRADDTLYTLGTNLSANGSDVDIKGGEYHFVAEGTIGGSTISLQLRIPGSSSYTDVQVFTGSVVKSTALPFNQSGIDLPAGKVRVALTGGTPSAVNAYLVGLG